MLTCIVSVCAVFNSFHRYFELMAHFTFIYLMVSVVCCVLLLLYKCNKLAIIMLVLVIVHLFSILPWYFNAKSDKVFEHKTNLKILHSNVLSSNNQFTLFSDLIAKEQPTIVVVQEVNKAWVQALSGTLASYKYRVERPQNDNFGIAIYSRLPFIETDIVTLGDIGIPSIEVKFSHKGQLVTLLATHPLPPINSEYFMARNTQLMAAASRLTKQSGAKLLVGDLNVSMWSSDYVAIEAITGLRNARYGFGILPTWPANIPFMMIPIDHILTSTHFVVNNVKLGDNIGSDHLPVIVELALKPTHVTSNK